MGILVGVWGPGLTGGLEEGYPGTLAQPGSDEVLVGWDLTRSQPGLGLRGAGFRAKSPYNHPCVHY